MMEQAEEAGKPVPSHLLPPPLYAGAAELVTTFWELSADRQVGMALGPIPTKSLWDWFDRTRLTDLDDQAVVTSAIRAMDRVFLAHSNKRRSPPGKQTPGVEISPFVPPLTVGAFDAMFAPQKALDKMRKK